LRDTEYERARFDRMLEATGFGVLQVDARGRLAYANPAAAQHLGYPQEDLLRLSLPRLFPPAVIGDPQTTPPVVAAFRTNERYFGEDTLVRADASTVPVDVGIYPVDIDEGPVGAVIIFQNTTERMLREQRQEEFLALAAHELRTPLTSILGFSRRLDRRRAQLDPETADAVGTLLTQSERMRSTIDAFLDMARLEADVFRVEIEPLALRQVVATEVAELEERSPEATVEFDAAEVPAIIESDEMRLRQVLVNLLNNAVRHGGSPPQVRVRVYPRGGGFAVSISDNGHGIAPEDRPHIFDRFYRRPGSEPRGQGLGVGLYLSRQIADRLGASLTFETEVGRGTTFDLLLPTQYAPDRRQWSPSGTRDRSLRPSA
jgi:two-component system phosphate regulon sensor histidine kinase PhoR